MSKTFKINEKTRDFLEDFNRFTQYIIENQVTLPTEKHEFNDGIYNFKVSKSKKRFARLQLSAHNTLEDLHNLIQEAFNIDNDHLYSFFMDGIPWSSNRFNCRYDYDGPYAHEAKIGDLTLSENQSFLYLFDFGDELMFEVKVESIERSE